MKKSTPFCLFLSISALGQHNEFQINFQPSDFKNISEKTSLSYYRSVSDNTAFGIQGYYYHMKSESDHLILEKFSAALDLVQRWSFLQFGSFRLFNELGVTIAREGQNNRLPFMNEPGVLYCGNIFLDADYINQGWVKANRLGAYVGLGADVQIFNRWILGVDYGFRYFRINDSEYNWDKKSQNSLSVNLGVKF